MSQFDAAAFVREFVEEVWNQKQVGLLYERATSNVLVHYSNHDDRYGRETLIHDTIRDLAAFPNLTVTLDSLLCQAERDGSYRVAMQQTWHGRNSGHSIYGPPTHQEVTQRRLINGRIVGGRFVELWVASDELALLRQLGLETDAVLARLQDGFEREPTDSSELGRVVGEIERGRGQMGPSPFQPLADNDPSSEGLIRQSQHDIWNRRLIGSVQAYYAETLQGGVERRARAGGQRATAGPGAGLSCHVS